jgi:hypothetical protein
MLREGKKGKLGRWKEMIKRMQTPDAAPGCCHHRLMDAERREEVETRAMERKD